MQVLDKREVVRICRIKVEEFEANRPRVPYQVVRDSAEMGEVMAHELVDLVAANNKASKSTRAIVPCGPMAWYQPFARLVNEGRVSLRKLTVFHMDECLDWQGRLLPKSHPLNFRAVMEDVFYGPIDPALAVPEGQRFWMQPDLLAGYRAAFWSAPVDLCLGGWGQDGHIAYNQARREPFSPVSLDELRQAEMRVQNNNWDTVIALGQRNFGAAYQLVPPMSCTIGVRECLSAKRVRVFSDTGAWKMTAFRAALFAPPCAEYPLTLLQEHPDAKVTATRETAAHPLSLHPEWEFPGV